MTLSQAQTAFYGTSTKLLAAAQQLYAGAKLMVDQSIDVKQSGNGITPIFGANLSLMNNKLNIGFKYEFITHLTLTNSTPAGKGYLIGFNTDGTPKYMFPDGEKINADIPSMISIGVSYKVTDKFSVQGGAHFYGDRNTGWKDVKSTVGKNFQEYGLGLEYNITPKLLVSAGYIYAKTGVNQAYQSSLGYSLTTNTVGLGGKFQFSDRVALNVGGYLVNYQPSTYTYSENIGTVAVPYKTTYDKSTFGVSVGLDLKLGH
jgi:long-chain fatty acid transport protein